MRERELWITYRNHEGKIKENAIIPVDGSFRFAETEWYPKATWVFDADVAGLTDQEKPFRRTFAIDRIIACRLGPSDSDVSCQAFGRLRHYMGNVDLAKIRVRLGVRPNPHGKGQAIMLAAFEDARSPRPEDFPLFRDLFTEQMVP